MNITEFLLQRIAEDEAVARDASHQEIAGPFHGNWRADSLHLVSMERADAMHMDRHDPARVLRECEAKRAIIGLHEDAGASQGDTDEGYRVIEQACAVCGTFGEYGEPWPCVTIRALAAVYSDHPDYQPEWAPQQ